MGDGMETPTQSPTQYLGGRLGGTLHARRWDAILMRVTRMSRANAENVRPGAMSVFDDTSPTWA